MNVKQYCKYCGNVRFIFVLVVLLVQINCYSVLCNFQEQQKRELANQPPNAAPIIQTQSQDPCPPNPSLPEIKIQVHPTYLILYLPSLS